MIHIIVGSTLGNSEYVADHINDVLQKNNLETKLYTKPQLADVENKGIWLIVTSTYAAGDYPDNIKPFMNDLKSTPPRMDQVKFTVVAIGDTSYDTFCAAGKKAKETMLDIGTPLLCEGLEIDVLEYPIAEDYAEQWVIQQLDHFKNNCG